MRSAWSIGALLLLSLVSSPAIAEDRAVLIGAGKYASGKWGLELVSENIRLMEKSLVEEVGVSTENIHKLIDRSVTIPGVRRSLLNLTHAAKAGDRLFLYYTGHATKVTKQGAPIRAHFTWDTMLALGGDGFDPETLITDIDLKDWLRPVRKKGVLVIIFREACFCGGGYAQDISSLSPGKPPAREPVGDIEISACDIDQAAWALDGAPIPAALFTTCLAECLSSDVQKISARNLYDTLCTRVSRKQRNQTPILDLGKGIDPTQVILVDRTLVDLIVNVTDAVTGESISGADVVVKLAGIEKSWSSKAPNALLSGVPRHKLLFPWIEKKGYVAKSQKIDVPQKTRTVFASVELEPEVAEVKGRLHIEGAGSLADISIAYETAALPIDYRHVDTEVQPNSNGFFGLRTPPHSSCKLMILKGKSLIEIVTVNDGQELRPIRYYSKSQEKWSGTSYDVGSIRIRAPAARATNSTMLEVPGFTHLREETFSCGGIRNTVKIYHHKKTGLEFVLVPGETDIDPFLICRTECTQAVWKKVMGSTPWKDNDYVKEGYDYPATYICWEDVNSFCHEAGLRLPTENEWEHACRAGTSTEYCFGNSESELGDYGWYGGNAWDIGNKYAHRGRKKKANAFGLFDVHGNVWEWCQDHYSSGSVGRVVRGGSWNYVAGNCRSAFRSRCEPDYRDSILGFRPAFSLHDLSREGEKGTREEVRVPATSEAPTVSGFTYLRDETFSFGGVTNTVRIYKHEKTKLEVALVGNNEDIVVASPAGVGFALQYSSKRNTTSAMRLTDEILFDSGSLHFDTQSKRTLDWVRKEFKISGASSYGVSILGYADSNPGSNVEISFSRAVAVHDYLKTPGIKLNDILLVGCGSK